MMMIMMMIIQLIIIMTIVIITMMMMMIVITQAARSRAMPAAFSEEALEATPTPAAEYGPDHAQCSPQCHYQCTDPACEEESDYTIVSMLKYCTCVVISHDIILTETINYINCRSAARSARAPSARRAATSRTSRPAGCSAGDNNNNTNNNNIHNNNNNNHHNNNNNSINKQDYG